MIAQTGKYGQYAGHVVIDYDEKKHAVVHKTADIVPLREKSDEVTEETLKELLAEGTANMQQVVASLDHDLTVDWFHESELPQMMADALRKWCKADIGLVNAGVILGELKAGPVTQFDIHRICPHPINPCQVYNRQGNHFDGKQGSAEIFPNLSID
ncbi:5'-nucleotidase C-terminal domain-containing protein [Terrilactibacillus sp. S3-3]|nr:5'-nucleotidase C-terminal domain-containing protein [Terrilactibacillus sp. S3-3]